jgi:signal peptidase I
MHNTEVVTARARLSGLKSLNNDAYCTAGAFSRPDCYTSSATSMTPRAADRTIANIPRSMVLCGAMNSDLARLFLVVLLVCSLSCQATNRVFTVPNSSMEPTIRQGKKIAADMKPFLPTHGDLVIFVHEQILVAKRVIGIPGDVVEGHDLKMFVNGKPLEEVYVEHIAKSPLGLKTLDTFGPTVVPNGKLFVAGDNRDYSFDSRDPRFGLVDASDVKG